MADVKLHLATSKIWDYFFENMDFMQYEEACIAESKETGMSLYLTAHAVIFPQLVLYLRDVPVYAKCVNNEKECSMYAVYLISKYVAGIPTEGSPVVKEEKPKVIELPMKKAEEVEPVDVPDEEYDEEEEEQRITDKIYEREDELTQAMSDLLAVVLCEYDSNAVIEGYGTQMVNEIVDDFLQYLADTHNVSVYRPTLETDPETGEEILKEFPYGWDENYEDIE